uniref:Lon protease ) n=1 Tax=Ganoderma boninense TaxID=34458 RepID=A0A5K1JV68_9APHY|nr:Lon protease (EC (ATP-dependent protease La) [Ganoderma boninense]
MKEIVYVQAGSFANFVGSHFWNTQEGYFTYGDGDDPLVEHDREKRHTAQDYCYLTGHRTSGLSPTNSTPITRPPAADWDGGVVEYRQDPIPKSEYHTRLETGELELDAASEDPSTSTTGLSRVRFWSDYSRVFLHPRTPQRLPDLADWDAIDGDWNKSKEGFQKYVSDHDLMENELRSFVEECDGLQGLQLMSDCVAFGGFTDAFLTAFRDEFPKLPSLAFPFLSNASNTLVTVEEPEAAKTLNDAFCIRSLENLSTLNVPIQHPSTWKQGGWLEDLSFDLRSPYLTSALVSTHIESATLPLRLKASDHALASMGTLLNMSGTTRTAHLAGIYPLYASTLAQDVPVKLYDLSVVTESRSKPVAVCLPLAASVATVDPVPTHEICRLPSANTDVCKSSAETSRPHNGRSSTKSFPCVSPHASGTDEQLRDSVHAPAYPTPTSFPRIVSPASPLDSDSDRHNVYSALSTSSASATLFAGYARLAQECVDRRAEVVTRMGLEFDEVRELKDELWALCDRYAAADEDLGGGEGEDVEMGEDEE